MQNSALQAHLGPLLPSSGLPAAPFLAAWVFLSCKCNRLSKAGSATSLHSNQQLLLEGMQCDMVHTVPVTTTKHEGHSTSPLNISRLQDTGIR